MSLIDHIRMHPYLIVWGVFLSLITTWIVAAAYGVFLFVTKVVILPFLLIAAIGSVGARMFFRDWAIFLALIALFDSIRGGIYLIVREYGLPVYMGYAIRWEEKVAGVPSVPHLLQNLWLAKMPNWFEGFLVMLHGSHFLFFLFFGFFVYRCRPMVFPVFKKGFLMIAYLGLLCYFLVPTVPPWMAANEFGVLPPLTRIIDSYYFVHAHELFQFFNTNEIAAMPSLHVAFPMFCAFLALRHFNRIIGLTVVLYAFATAFASVYLGEHYLVDALGGVFFGGLGYLVAEKFFRPLFKTEQVGLDGDINLLPKILNRPLSKGSIGIFFLVVLLGLEVGFFNRSHWRPLIPDEKFIVSELEGVSDLESFYRGLLAADRGDWETARKKILQGMKFSQVGNFYGFKRLLYTLKSEEDASQIIHILSALPVEQRGTGGQKLLRALQESFPRLAKSEMSSKS